MIGDSDAHTVAVDMDSKEVKCNCDGEYYLKTCCHEVAVHLALSILSYDEPSEVKESLFEDPSLFVRNEKLR